ncbi:hypothetical protein ACMT4L_03110 [Deinococcus sp. A31D244]|uniref:hypothetical protein n=1 Tax=Deinococcus sp. A31D244 TaxID=3397675 RepID=UPI0039E01C96
MTLTLNDLREQLKSLSVLPEMPDLLSLTHAERLTVMENLNRWDERAARYKMQQDALVTQTIALLRPGHPPITDTQAQIIEAVFYTELRDLKRHQLTLDGYDQLAEWYARAMSALHAPIVIGPVLSSDELRKLRNRLKEIRVTHLWANVTPYILLNSSPEERMELVNGLSECDQSRVTLAREIRAALNLLSGTLKHPGVNDEEHVALLAALGALPIPEEFTTNAHAVTLALVARYENVTGGKGTA